ncbi:MAG: hypothetical protein J5829_02065 [Lachnospiraceae bacterium]|nr:hypothetical protein [Lachnospiraceae bacterium]
MKKTIYTVTVLAMVMAMMTACGKKAELAYDVNKEHEEIMGEKPKEEEPEKEPKEEPVKEPSIFPDIKAGDYVEFGRYEQDCDSSNGPEPVEWKVLDVDGNRVLLISRYVLEQKEYCIEPYDIKWDVTWGDSTLRPWLNFDFYDMAFDDDEKKHIETTHLENKEHPFRHTEGGADTDDRVFILSFEELEKYFDLHIPEDWGDWSRASGDLITDATDYAKTRGLGTDIVDTDTCDMYGYSHEFVGKHGVDWWMRTPGSYSGTETAFVSGSGFLGDECDWAVDSTRVGVRPAMWISRCESRSVSDTPDDDMKKDERYWKYRYLEYINDVVQEDAPAMRYQFVYIDDDDIPELVMDSGTIAFGQAVLSCHDGKVACLDGVNADYIERSGLIYSATGQMGSYPYEIYRLENGKFDLIDSGRYEEWPEGGTHYYLEENEVSEDEYNKHINGIFDTSKKSRIENFVSYDHFLRFVEKEIEKE